MPDDCFTDSRLVAVYDVFEGPRDDLDLYEELIEGLAARSVLDIGCGTGALACRLAASGVDVVGVDPAGPSLELARQKPWADRVRWVHGDASVVPILGVDLAVMTGNVAQVFLTDTEWDETLAAVARAVRPRGHLVFETRDPGRRAWERWTPEATRSVREVPGVGAVESWVRVRSVDLPLVSFRWTYRFDVDGAVLASDSTLCFRTREEIERSLERTGWQVDEVLDAPDRPGEEFVFVAHHT